MQKEEQKRTEATCCSLGFGIIQECVQTKKGKTPSHELKSTTHASRKSRPSTK
jgi:hypothetical protein